MAKVKLSIWTSKYGQSGNADVEVMIYDRTVNRLLETIWRGHVSGGITLSLTPVTKPPDYAITYIFQGYSTDIVGSADFVGVDVYEDDAEYNVALYFYGQRRILAEMIREQEEAKKKVEVTTTQEGTVWYIPPTSSISKSVEEPLIKISYGEVAPIPEAKEAEPLIQEAEPLTQKTEPLTQEAEPLIQEVTPSISMATTDLSQYWWILLIAIAILFLIYAIWR